MRPSTLVLICIVIFAPFLPELDPKKISYYGPTIIGIPFVIWQIRDWIRLERTDSMATAYMAEMEKEYQRKISELKNMQ